MPPQTTPPVAIDGSAHEGGGQILRNAAALAACTGVAMRVLDVRKGRQPKPGLRPQVGGLCE